MKNRHFFRNKRIVEWLKAKDPYTYYREHQLDEEVPEELREPLQRLADCVEDKCGEEFSQKQLEFDALQSRINPHFLYNTLEAVRAKALLSGADEVERMVYYLSRFFRYSISARGELVLLEEEVSSIEDYFRIQKYRFQDRFSLQIEWGDTRAQSALVPKMILQPLIENALFHGLEPQKGNGDIRVGIEMTERAVVIRISDDGIGISEDQLRKINNMLHACPVQPMEKSDYQLKNKERKGALYNINARARLFGGKDYGIVVHSIPGIGTDVELILPYMTENTYGMEADSEN